MALIPDSLKESIKSKLPFSGGGTKESSSPTPDRSVKEFQIAAKIIAKNFMSLPGIARDLNVARQNAQQLVKVMGGKAATGADDEFLKASKREKKLEVESEEERAKDLEFFKEQQKEKEKAPTQIITQEKLKDENKPSTIFDKLKKYLALGVLVTLFVVTFFDDFVAKVKEWANNLWTTIKEKFDEFVQYMRNWFDETVQPIIENVKEIFNKVIEKISAFFTSVGEWVAEKFAKIKEFFEPVVEFIKGVFDKFMGVIDKVKEGFQKFKDFIKPYVENALDTPIVKYLPPVLALKALTGAKSPEEKKEEKKKPVPVTPGYEEGAAADAMISGIEGESYIPEPEAPPPKPPPPKPPAPTPTPTPAPTPAPQEGVLVDSEGRPVQTGFGEDIRTGEMEPPAPTPTPAPPPAPAPARPSVAPTPAPPPKPITEQPPTPTGKAAEGPEKQIGGSLTSVVSTQSGVDMSGLHPEFQKRLTAMATAFKEQTGKKLLITSAYRSNEKQAELFNAKLKEFGGDRAKTRKMVAEPMPPLGKGNGSFHLKGLAIDINSKGPAGINVLAGDRESPTGWLEKFGLTRPVKKENWHIQPIGTLPTADNPVNPGAPTLVAGKDAKPMNLAEGKKESIGQPEPTSSAPSGDTVAAASTDVASGQRGQQKPTTPIIINSPKTTNTVVQNNIPSSGAKSKTDAGKTLMNRVT
jgi:DNA replication initiation complex subunit (GINS family)